MPDYMFLLESRLSAEQRAAVVRIQELAASLGANVYLVGGAVRDLISGMPIRDLDFTIEGNPFRVASELVKGGARIVTEDQKMRHVELVFAGDADGSVAAARDDVYHRPGTRPEIRWSTIMEDLRRRDFSLNAIAISLNPASRGLLLDPTNGLADLEKREVRALSIHSFTNQPVRLLRALRYCARMGFRPELRTAEWFALAIERGLDKEISGGDAGQEVRQLTREENPAPILKLWEAKNVLAAVHPQLARRHPDYKALQRLVRSRDTLVAAGYRPRLFAPAMVALLGRLKSRERTATLARLEFRAAEKEAVTDLESAAEKAAKLLGSRKMAAPREAFASLEKLPIDQVAFILGEGLNARAISRIRAYLHKWRPLRQALPSVEKELEGLGLPRGPKFDKVMEELFQLQLLGKGRNPEERLKLLRKLAGIKEPPKKKIKEEKKKPPKGAEKKAKSKAVAPEAPAGSIPAVLPVPASVSEKVDKSAAKHPPAPAEKKLRVTPVKKVRPARKPPRKRRHAPRPKGKGKRRH